MLRELKLVKIDHNAHQGIRLSIKWASSSRIRLHRVSPIIESVSCFSVLNICSYPRLHRVR